MDSALKHQNTINESITRLLARAANSRGLETADLETRIGATVEKYVFTDSPNAGSAEINDFVDALNADDLCLIAACEKSDETAWAELVEKYDATVKSAARKISASVDDADDLASSIWAELYGLKKKDGKARGKLAYYSGRGSLAGWLRAVVAQLAVDQFRKTSRFVQIEETREFENLAQSSAEHSENSKVVHQTETPEEQLSDSEAKRDVSNALKQAVSELAAEDRLITKLYYFDDLKLKDIGATLGFHEATASRKLVRIQTEIRKSVEKILCEKYGWRREEVKRHLAETASKLDLSVEKLFGWLILAVLMQEYWR